MNLIKSYDFFKPETVTQRIHIIGCGSVGATLAENLVRCGLTKLTLYDFDKVESKNIANQIFREKDIGEFKVDALYWILSEINPELNLERIYSGWTGQKLSGYVFLCVDNIEVRKEIVKSHFNNLNVKAMFDFRTRLTDAQHYAALWSDYKQKENFLKSMDFSHDEAMNETETSACGITLAVCPTIRIIVGYGVANFINYCKTKELKQLILADVFGFNTTAI